MSEYKKLGAAAIAVVSLAAVTLTGMAVVAGFKNTGLIDNNSATLFLTGLTIFATFTSVIALALVGKIIVSIFKTGKGE